MDTQIDPAELSIAAALFASVADEMGVTLGRTAHSPNIKERRDYSCAVFDPRGHLVAQAAHIPVHLGAMPESVAAAMTLSAHPEVSKGHPEPGQSAPAAPVEGFAPSDIVILNDPYLGGTHLPDITMVSPVFLPPSPAHGRGAGGEGTLIGFLASRAHHADVGGISPGSMPIAEELIQEGIVIPPIKLFEAGKLNQAVLDLLLRNMRAPGERRGDLDAQIAAHRTGEDRLREITARYGADQAWRLMDELMDYAERMTRAAIAAVPNGTYTFEDFLDDDGSTNVADGFSLPPAGADVDVILRNEESGAEGPMPRSGTTPESARPTRASGRAEAHRSGPVLPSPAHGRGAGGEGLIPIRVRITVSGETLHADFTGSSPERPTSINAVAAVTRSAVYYCVRCLLEALPGGDSVPSNEGCFRPVTLTLPERSVVNAGPPRAVAAGNVETSQRIVDVVLGALARALPDVIPAASQGTMNNITIGGHLPGNVADGFSLPQGGAGGGPPSPAHGRGAGGEGSSSSFHLPSSRPQSFAYYETIGGGAGASPSRDGLDAVHTHMTNTLNTPVEALEMTYPFRVTEYAVRRGSGGPGLHRGGDGITRTYEFLAEATVTLLTERRRLAPWGLDGGAPGAPGRNYISRLSTENVADGFSLPQDSGDAGQTQELPSKTSLRVHPGDRLTIETPGGGGWGKP